MSSEVYPIYGEVIVDAAVVIAGVSALTLGYLRWYRSNIFKRDSSTQINLEKGSVTPEMKRVMDKDSSTTLHKKGITDY